MLNSQNVYQNKWPKKKLLQMKYDKWVWKIHFECKMLLMQLKMSNDNICSILQSSPQRYFGIIGRSMPARRGLLAPQNTFLDTIATRFDGTRKYKLKTFFHLFNLYMHSDAHIETVLNTNEICSLTIFIVSII